MSSRGVSVGIKTRRRVSNAFSIIVLAIFTAIIIFPLIAVLLNSLKTQSQFYQSPWSWPSPFVIKNYLDAWQQAHIPKFMANSLLVGAATTFLTLVTASLAGYAFARFRFRGGKFLFGLFALLLIVPAPMSVIPLYVIVSELGLVNTYWSLILPQTASSLPLAIYLMKTFIAGIPSELIEAARADGCSHMGAFWRIVLPISTPGLATAGILVFVNSWNEFLLALVFIHDDDLMTLPLGLQTFIYQYRVEWPLYFAGLTTAIVPVIVVYVLFQKYVVLGLTAGAVQN